MEAAAMITVSSVKTNKSHAVHSQRSTISDVEERVFVLCHEQWAFYDNLSPTEIIRRALSRRHPVEHSIVPLNNDFHRTLSVCLHIQAYGRTEKTSQQVARAIGFSYTYSAEIRPYIHGLISPSALAVQEAQSAEAWNPRPKTAHKAVVR